MRAAGEGSISISPGRGKNNSSPGTDDGFQNSLSLWHCGSSVRGAPPCMGIVTVSPCSLLPRGTGVTCPASLLPAAKVLPAMSSLAVLRLDLTVEASKRVCVFEDCQAPGGALGVSPAVPVVGEW